HGLHPLAVLCHQGCQFFRPTRPGHHAVPCGQRRLGDVPAQSVSASRNQPDLSHKILRSPSLNRQWALGSASWPRERLYCDYLFGVPLREDSFAPNLGAGGSRGNVSLTASGPPPTFAGERYSYREIIKRRRTAACSKRFGTPGAPSVDTCPPQYAS